MSYSIAHLARLALRLLDILAYRICNHFQKFYMHIINHIYIIFTLYITDLL